MSFAYRDGGEEDKNLLPREIEYRVVKLPTLIEYSSFVCYCCGGCVGPVMEYMEFKNFMELNGVYKTLPRGSQFFPTVWQWFYSFASSLLATGGLVFLSSSGISVDFVGSKDFANYGTIFHRIGYYWLTMTMNKLNYYSAWLMIDASTAASGLAYSGTKNGVHEWENVVSIHVWKLETEPSCVK